MKLDEGEFRTHVEGMIENRDFKQLEMWIEHGLLIYTNVDSLRKIWDDEYESTVDSAT